MVEMSERLLRSPILFDTEGSDLDSLTASAANSAIFLCAQLTERHDGLAFEPAPSFPNTTDD